MAPAMPSAPASLGAVGSAVAPPPVPVPDLAAMRPRSPTEVVELARRHLALEPPFVVARAKELEPDRERRREPAQLQALWQDLLEHAPRTGAEPAPHPTTPTAVAPSPAPADTAPPAGSSADAAPPAGSSADTVPPAGAPEVDSPVTQPQDRPEPETLPPSAEADDGLAPTDFDEEVDDFDLAELHALDEAPSHAHDIEQKLKSAFPGTQFGVLPDPDDEAAAGSEA